MRWSLDVDPSPGHILHQMRLVRQSIRKVFQWLFVIFFASYSAEQAAEPPSAPTRLYATAYSLPLTQRINGVDGHLQLRQDARLNEKLSQLLWGSGGDNLEGKQALAVFKGAPPRNAVIQLVDSAGKVLHSEVLERPLAKLRIEHLYGDVRRTYLLTVDYSAGFGSYSGPITSFIEVHDGHMEWVKSTESKTGHTEKISLMDSLKTTWKFVNAPGGHGKQILLAQCRPDWSSVKDDPDFRITYARFFFYGTSWFVLRRTVKGYSDFEKGLPSRKHFP